MARLRRVHVPGIAPSAEDRVPLPEDEAHHVRKVLRLRAGDSLSVFNGEGREWSGTLSRVESGTVEVRIERERLDTVEAPLDVILFQALCRYDRVEWAIQKATEVGVRGIRVTPSERAEVEPPPPKRLTRWRRVALEACKQSGRRRVPGVALAEELPDPAGEDVLALLLDTGPGVEGLGSLLSRPAPAEVWIAIGPEGGFSPDEATRLSARGWIRAGIGPRVLRTETAGVIASALVLHRWSDLGGSGAC